jgi:hypothetical protein
MKAMAESKAVTIFILRKLRPASSLGLGIRSEFRSRIDCASSKSLITLLSWFSECPDAKGYQPEKKETQGGGKQHVAVRQLSPTNGPKCREHSPAISRPQAIEDQIERLLRSLEPTPSFAFQSVIRLRRLHHARIIVVERADRQKSQSNDRRRLARRSSTAYHGTGFL